MEQEVRAKVWDRWNETAAHGSGQVSANIWKHGWHKFHRGLCENLRKIFHDFSRALQSHTHQKHILWFSCVPLKHVLPSPHKGACLRLPSSLFPSWVSPGSLDCLQWGRREESLPTSLSLPMCSRWAIDQLTLNLLHNYASLQGIKASLSYYACCILDCWWLFLKWGQKVWWRV